MYYYIFDIKRFKKNSAIQEIRNYLSVLGISGEFTYPSAAYTTEELVQLGLSKKYNTIVVIGGDEIANKVSGILCGSDAAMGVIPLESSEDLKALVGAKTWKEACDNLRFRKISEIKIGKTANGAGFLTTLLLALKHPTEITVEFKDYMAQAKVKNFLISNFSTKITKLGPDFLDIVFQSIGKTESTLSRLSEILGILKETDKSYSMLRARSMRLFTNSQIPLVSGKDIIAKTPQLIESSDENLRLIVGKKAVPQSD